MEKFNDISICVNFDGTIVEYDYPRIGEPVPGAIESLKRLQDYGTNIILFTMRSGTQLLQSINYLKVNGINLYGININPSQTEWTQSPKSYGDYYIDDSALGTPLIYKNGKKPYVNWKEVMIELETRINKEL